MFSGVPIAVSQSPRAWCCVHGAAAIATVSMRVLRSAMFARAVTGAFCPSGVSVRGVSGRDLLRLLQHARPARDTTATANTAAENSCALCIIVPGVAGRFAGPGGFSPSRKYAVDAAGPWILRSGIIAPGVSRDLSDSLKEFCKIEVRHTFGKKKVSRASCPRFEGGTPSTRICCIYFFLSKKDA